MILAWRRYVLTQRVVAQIPDSHSLVIFQLPNSMIQEHSKASQLARKLT